MEERLPNLLVSPEDFPPYLLLPGDPARAIEIARHLEKSEAIAKNREFHSYRGYYKELEMGAPGAARCDGTSAQLLPNGYPALADLDVPVALGKHYVKQ
ncbi:MAG: hypothetical protein U9Q23_04990 [Candidatus Bipolaricaulota bacterium]|nr:hypothetical protein [Candidatus Bipolaricaulota bacterium]